MVEQIEYIKLNLKIYLNKLDTNPELNEFESDITSNTSLTYNQYILLKYIELLEELEDDWQILNSNNLINNNLIRSPYIIAYNIREILKIPIHDDEENNPIVWLSINEKLCINKMKKTYEDNE